MIYILLIPTAILTTSVLDKTLAIGKQLIEEGQRQFEKSSFNKSKYFKEFLSEKSKQFDQYDIETYRHPECPHLTEFEEYAKLLAFSIDVSKELGPNMAEYPLLTGNFNPIVMAYFTQSRQSLLVSESRLIYDKLEKEYQGSVLHISMEGQLAHMNKYLNSNIGNYLKNINVKATSTMNYFRRIASESLGDDLIYHCDTNIPEIFHFDNNLFDYDFSHVYDAYAIVKFLRARREIMKLLNELGTLRGRNALLKRAFLGSAILRVYGKCLSNWFPFESKWLVRQEAIQNEFHRGILFLSKLFEDCSSLEEDDSRERSARILNVFRQPNIVREEVEFDYGEETPTERHDSVDLEEEEEEEEEDFTTKMCSDVFKEMNRPSDTYVNYLHEFIETRWNIIDIGAPTFFGVTNYSRFASLPKEFSDPRLRHRNSSAAIPFPIMTLPPRLLVKEVEKKEGEKKEEELRQVKSPRMEPRMEESSRKLQSSDSDISSDVDHHDLVVNRGPICFLCENVLLNRYKDDVFFKIPLEQSALVNRVTSFSTQFLTTFSSTGEKIYGIAESLEQLPPRLFDSHPYAFIDPFERSIFAKPTYHLLKPRLDTGSRSLEALRDISAIVRRPDFSTYYFMRGLRKAKQVYNDFANTAILNENLKQLELNARLDDSRILDRSSHNLNQTLVDHSQVSRNVTIDQMSHSMIQDKPTGITSHSGLREDQYIADTGALRFDAFLKENAMADVIDEHGKSAIFYGVTHQGPKDYIAMRSRQYSLLSDLLKNSEIDSLNLSVTDIVEDVLQEKIEDRKRLLETQKDKRKDSDFVDENFVSQLKNLTGKSTGSLDQTRIEEFKLSDRFQPNINFTLLRVDNMKSVVENMMVLSTYRIRHICLSFEKLILEPSLNHSIDKNKVSHYPILIQKVINGVFDIMTEKINKFKKFNDSAPHSLYTVLNRAILQRPHRLYLLAFQTIFDECDQHRTKLSNEEGRLFSQDIEKHVDFYGGIRENLLNLVLSYVKTFDEILSFKNEELINNSLFYPSIYRHIWLNNFASLIEKEEILRLEGDIVNGVVMDNMALDTRYAPNQVYDGDTLRELSDTLKRDFVADVEECCQVYIES